MLTFGTVFGLVMIHVITNALEIPFGEEFMDLPLLEMHTGFNRNLLACFVEGEEKHPILADLDRKRAERLRTPVNNIEYFAPNFEGLVLGCIDADFCK